MLRLRPITVVAAVALLVTVATGPAVAATPASSVLTGASMGAGSRLARGADLEVARVTGRLPDRGEHWAVDIGGTSAAARLDGGYKAPVVPMLMSLVLPGAGEVYLGYKRGFFQMALDVASWYGVAHNADQGKQKRDEYYAFADEHWFLGKLDAAYDPAYLDRADANFDFAQVVGRGTDYFQVNGFTSLPLWVSAIDDRREYYENLGKWNQFVFGWDDFVDPRIFLGTSDIDIANLNDPRVSTNRETYRQMRQDSNAAFARRDRFLYLSLGMRVFSVLQVAYLEGLFGDGANGGMNESRRLEVAGHQVDLIVAPVGLERGVVGAAVWF